MLRRPKTLPVSVTVAEAAAALAAEHMHMLLLTDGPVLAGTLVDGDLPASEDIPSRLAEPALRYARLRGRTVSPDRSAADVERTMARSGIRRLAVVDEHDALLGLMCLKGRGRGFCSDDGVSARRADRVAGDSI